MITKRRPTGTGNQERRGNVNYEEEKMRELKRRCINGFLSSFDKIFQATSIVHKHLFLLHLRD